MIRISLVWLTLDASFSRDTTNISLKYIYTTLMVNFWLVVLAAECKNYCHLIYFFFWKRKIAHVIFAVKTNISFLKGIMIYSCISLVFWIIYRLYTAPFVHWHNLFFFVSSSHHILNISNLNIVFFYLFHLYI